MVVPLAAIQFYPGNALPLQQNPLDCRHCTLRPNCINFQRANRIGLSFRWVARSVAIGPTALAPSGRAQVGVTGVAMSLALGRILKNCSMGYENLEVKTSHRILGDLGHEEESFNRSADSVCRAASRGRCGGGIALQGLVKSPCVRGISNYTVPVSHA
jgi:hypothetical protein